MVSGISQADSQKSPFSEVRKNQVVVAPPIATSPVANAPVIVRPISQDQVLLSRPKKKTDTARDIQMGVAILGGVATVVIAISAVLSARAFMPSKAMKKTVEKIAEDTNAAKLPEKVKEYIASEAKKLGTMEHDSALNYINNVQRLPYAKAEPKKIDIEEAKKVLDKKLIGLDEIKDEILSYLKYEQYCIENGIEKKARKLLCLVGPPGTAKTSIAQIIAEIQGKPFERITLGGESQSTFIKGTERVFKNSSPGQIIKSMQNAKVKDPVILLDEVDKMGNNTEHGGSAPALLDVLEPQQCKNFTDKFLEFAYDLSDVNFILTANDIRRVPKELANRLRIIDIKPYSKETKTAICNRKLEELMKDFKLDNSRVVVRPVAIQEIVNRTSDQGARRTMDNLERVFEDVISEIQTNGKNHKVVVDQAFVNNALKNIRKEGLDA